MPYTHEKSKLLLLIERLESNPNPPEQKMVLMTEYHASISLAAMEALDELKRAEDLVSGGYK